MVEKKYTLFGGRNDKIGIKQKGMVKIKKVFISHPFRGDEETNRLKVDKICNNIMEENKDILPISPLHLWSFMEEDGIYRQEILLFCFNLIFISDEVWFYKYGELSSGQKKELEYAKLANKKIRIIEMG